jgi:hypothetical protein
MTKQLGKIIVALGAAAALTCSAYGWSTDGHGNITCSDRSKATVAQQSDDTWIITQAGNNGRTDGSYATDGKAAAHACGEEG